MLPARFLRHGGHPFSASPMARGLQKVRMRSGTRPRPGRTHPTSSFFRAGHPRPHFFASPSARAFHGDPASRVTYRTATRRELLPVPAPVSVTVSDRVRKPGCAGLAARQRTRRPPAQTSHAPVAPVSAWCERSSRSRKRRNVAVSRAMLRICQRETPWSARHANERGGCSTVPRRCSQSWSGG